MGAADEDGDGPVPWLDTTVIALLALVVAAPALGAPARLVYDESYYVVDAVAHLRQGVGSTFQAHPPLGPWLIAAGVALVDGPVGWRLSTLVFGVLAPVFLHRLAGRLLPDGPTGRVLAAAAPVLLITDGSWLIFARTAMLDGPVTTLAVAAVAAAVAATRSRDRSVRAWWLVAAGAAVGASTAVKWSGALAGVLVAVVLVVMADHDALARRIRTGLTGAATAGVVALVVYAVAWVPFALARDDVPLEECWDQAAPCTEQGGLTGVLEQHASLFRYHADIRAVDVGESPPGGWPLLQGSLGFFRPGCNVIEDPERGLDGRVPVCDEQPVPGEDTIRYVGNPVVWIGFLALVPVLAVGARRGDRAALVALVGWALHWLPWLAVTRIAYVWYLAPAIPFAALGIVAGARRLRGEGVPATILGVGGALVGGLVGLVTPIGPTAAAIVGWGLLPFVLGADDPAASEPVRVDDDARTRRTQTIAVAAFVVPAVVLSALLRTTWTVSPDSPVDRVAQADSAAGTSRS